jgi:hypothetical protein
MNDSSNIGKSFRKSIFALTMIIVALIFGLINKIKHYSILEYFILIPLLIAAIFAVMGTIHGLKGLKEKKTPRFFVSLILNLTISIAFFILLISTLIGISKIEH